VQTMARAEGHAVQHDSCCRKSRRLAPSDSPTPVRPVRQTADVEQLVFDLDRNRLE
jgi:hypothetical protein